MKHRKVHMIYMAAGNSRRFRGISFYILLMERLYRYGLRH